MKPTLRPSHAKWDFSASGTSGMLEEEDLTKAKTVITEAETAEKAVFCMFLSYIRRVNGESLQKKILVAQDRVHSSV